MMIQHPRPNGKRASSLPTPLLTLHIGAPGAPPDMPLPPLPADKARSSTPIAPRAAGSTRRIATPSSLPQLATNIATRHTSSPILSASRNAGPTLAHWTSLHSLKHSVSIGSFPRPPRGSIGSSQSFRSSRDISPTSGPNHVSTIDSTSQPTDTVKTPRQSTSKRSSSGSIPRRTTAPKSASTACLLTSLSQESSTVKVARRSSLNPRSSFSASSFNSHSPSEHGSHGSSQQPSSPDTRPPSALSDEEHTERGNVLVSVRVRPDQDKSKADAQHSDWSVEPDQARIAYHGSHGEEFFLDNVFSPRQQNSEIYNATTRRLVRKVMQGFHGTVFAYGMTGTGKTFSMQGISQSPGIVPLAVKDIFSYIRRTPDREFLLRTSYLEIYNEKIYDLLAADPSAPGDRPPEEIQLRQDKRRGVYATPLREEIVQSPTQLLKVIARGDASRRTASTLCNARSSRSHAVVQIVIESRERHTTSRDSDPPSGILVSTLSLIDLAGSEKASELKDQRTEGAHINKSLLTLGTIIARLSSDNKTTDVQHLPYRDSKLTRLLQSALSGEALISILCTIRLPSNTVANNPSGLGETLNTLKFASRAKNNIISRAKRNESLLARVGDAEGRALLDKYRLEILDLKQQLSAQTIADDAQTRQQKSQSWRERQRESIERHEAQMMELELARIALKERIGHLNQLVLSSRTMGSEKRDSDASYTWMASDGIGIAHGSPTPSRDASVDSLHLYAGRRSSSAARNSGSIASGTLYASSLADRSQTLFEVPHEDDDLNRALADGADHQLRSLQTELSDKTLYIMTLEKRLLQAKCGPGSGRRRSDDSHDNQQDLLEAKDRQLASLRLELEEQKRANRGLRVAASLETPDDKVDSILAGPRSRPGLVGQSQNFSRPAPMHMANTALNTPRQNSSVEDVTKLLDEMLQKQDLEHFFTRRNTMSSMRHESSPLMT